MQRPSLHCPPSPQPTAHSPQHWCLQGFRVEQGTPGALHSIEHTHHPCTAPRKPRKIKTGQILMGGRFQIQEESTRMLGCPGPRPFPHFPFSLQPFAELREENVLSPQTPCSKAMVSNEGK